jgi:hypothetical protein
MVEIVRTMWGRSNDADFVGIGNLPNRGESTHAAFIIQYQNDLFVFHYTGASIEYERPVEDYFHIATRVIHRDEVPAFIAQCLHIKRHARPHYGYFYSGQSYDQDGRHWAANDLGEVMTCVGFCLNVLKGFLEEDYLEYGDWDNSPFAFSSGYVAGFCQRYGLDVDRITPSHRRITPREGLISCLFSDLPIRKTQIDGQQARVQAHLDLLSI